MPTFVASESGYDYNHVHGVINAPNDKVAQRVATHLYGPYIYVELAEYVNAKDVRICARHPNYRGLLKPRVVCEWCDKVHAQAQRRKKKSR